MINEKRQDGKFSLTFFILGTNAFFDEGGDGDDAEIESDGGGDAEIESEGVGRDAEIEGVGDEGGDAEIEGVGAGSGGARETETGGGGGSG